MKAAIGRRYEQRHGSEQPPEYYDQTFREAKHWFKHYTETHYYPLWTLVADRVRNARTKRILDIGCGPGQVACLMYDQGVEEYVGIDFSEARIEQARKVCPQYSFYSVDIFNSDILESDSYDCVLIMEFLEHIEHDLDVLGRLRKGTRVLATVPNFSSPGHVRYFSDVGEVESRYSGAFESLCVQEHLGNARGKKYFLIEAMV